MKRALQPKPELVAVPLYVSDQTAFAIIGLSARQFRDALAAKPEVPRSRLGKRVLVAVADIPLLVGDAHAKPDPAAAEPETADDVLAAIGRRRVARAS